MAVPTKWMITLYAVLVFVLVSYSGTYKLTHSIYKAFGGKHSQEDYGKGLEFSNPGFWAHILVFALLVFIPMLDIVKRKFYIKSEFEIIHKK